jgi:hypothetical protein
MLNYYFNSIHYDIQGANQTTVEKIGGPLGNGSHQNA